MCTIHACANAHGKYRHNFLTRKVPKKMHEIQREYSILFNAITDTQSELMRLYARLVEAQQAAEELYISGQESAADNNVTVLMP